LRLLKNKGNRIQFYLESNLACELQAAPIELKLSGADASLNFLFFHSRCAFPESLSLTERSEP